MQLRIAICCCNYLFGEGIKRLIEDGLEMAVTIHCTKPEEVIEANPNLLITDYSSLSKISLDVLYDRGVEILLFGTDCLPKIEDDRLLLFIAKGLMGILSPMADSTQFKQAIRNIASGEPLFKWKRIQKIISKINAQIEKGPSLTNREKDVVKLICQGHCNKEIMNSLNISEQSVKAHLSRIYRKIGISDRLQLIIYAVRHWPNYFDKIT